MTTPNQEFPDDAILPGELEILDDLDEQRWRQKLDSQIVGKYRRAGTGLDERFGGFLKNMAQAVGGLFAGQNNYWGQISDGQLQLKDRTDLLSPLQDYGSAYMEAKNGINNTGRLPFTKQIGSTQGCTVMSSGLIRLHDQGLWDIRLQAKASWTALVGSGKVSWRINVLYPSSTYRVFSTQQYTSDTLSTHSITMISSVVVPDSGFYVEAYCDEIVAGREIRGGVQVSRLTVQHISRSTDFQIGDD